MSEYLSDIQLIRQQHQDNIQYIFRQLMPALFKYPVGGPPDPIISTQYFIQADHA